MPQSLLRLVWLGISVWPVLLQGIVPDAASGQTLIGVVLEEGRFVPVPGVFVSLVAPSGDRVVSVSTDTLGHFGITVPGPGEYILEATRIGYVTTRSPLLSISGGDTVPVELVLVPDPVGLEGFEVTVSREAEHFLRNFGQTPDRLQQRWIGRQEIESLPFSPGPRELIRWRGIPGLSVVEGASVVGPNAELCVTFRRGRTASGNDRCALVLLNGVPISRVEAQNLSPDDLEAIAILTPMDASTFYGGDGGGGVVLMWTRQGRS